MAETASDAKTALSVVVTTAERLSELNIKSGQFIFIKDKHRVAFDHNGSRVIYNQITELETDYERTTLSAPSYGYYFVISTAVLWYYQGSWQQITTQPDDIVFIGAELPELGQAKEGTLYVDKTNKEISVYDTDSNAYVVVADKTSNSVSIDTATEDDINALF